MVFGTARSVALRVVVLIKTKNVACRKTLSDHEVNPTAESRKSYDVPFPYLLVKHIMPMPVTTIAIASNPAPSRGSNHGCRPWPFFPLPT